MILSNKKIFCILFSFLLLFAYAGTLNAAALEPGLAENSQNSSGAGVETSMVPIIMYHSLLNKKTNQWNIPPSAFEKDLRYLSDNGYHTVWVSDLIEFVYNGKPLPDKPVVLTFDDGYYNNYEECIPLLEKYDMKMMLSVIGENTDLWTEHADETNKRYGHVTWPQIIEMVGTGRVELANHTQSLHKSKNGRNGCCRKKTEGPDEYERLLSEDVTCLQEKIENMCGVRPECFTYPFGSKCEESVDILKNLGFKASLSCTAGINRLSVDNPDCLIYMKRNNRTPNLSVKSILEKLESA